MTEAILRDACRTVLETFARIRADGGADAFRALARSRVVSWRDDIRHGGPDPVPWAQERFGRPPGEFSPPPRDRDERVGLDADGTIVIHERPGPEGAAPLVLSAALPAAGGITRVRHPGTVEQLVLDEDGRVVLVATTEDGQDVEVERWTWIEGRPARGAAASTWENEVGTRVTLRATFDDEGRLDELRRGFTGLGRFQAPGHDDEPPVTDAQALVPALSQALDAADADPDGDRVVWSAVTHRPEPPRADDDALVADLVSGLTRAIVVTVAGLDVQEPFVVRVDARRDHEPRPGPLPGQVTVGGDAIRRDARARPASGGALEALRATRDRPGHKATAPLQPACDAATLRACREFNTMAAHDGTEPDLHRCVRVLGDVRRGLARNLAQEVPAGAIDPFLHLVELATLYDSEYEIGWEAAAEVHGAEHVAAFRRSLSAPAVDEPADWSAANRDRATLERFLTEGGLPEHAGRLAHEIAEWGLRAEPATGRVTSRLGGPALLPPGTDWPRTSGGRALTFLAAVDLAELPAVEGGSPLPDAGVLLFFAVLDPDFADEVFEDEADNTPGSTVRVLFVPPGDRPQEREHPPELGAAGDGRRLRDRHVGFVPRLTLPTGYDTATTLGLEGASAEAYSTLAFALLDDAAPPRDPGRGSAEDDGEDDPDRGDDGRGATERPDPGPRAGSSEAGVDVREAVDRVVEAGRRGGWRGVLRAAHELAGEALERLDEPPAGGARRGPDLDDHDDGERGDAWERDDGYTLRGTHWVLGHEPGVQGHEPEPDTVLLLHLAWDEALGFTFADGGNFQFRIPATALAKGDWSAVVATADSS
ncbi:DUF1963 domain-containing protein [Paraconexibacter algicola]|uniref:DUF1963 domain-containing protein n=1 Tax=Paraconexibacter algicola TaxID=2133960 RepID=UPI0011B1D9C2|nr:DUF1963 domain-containing protein [Paraconexibacter algicola]